MSFYSLHIWNDAGSEEEDTEWNLGDGDPDVGNKIADALKLASLAARGDEQEDLDHRVDFIQEAESKTERDDNGAGLVENQAEARSVRYECIEHARF